MTPFDTTDPADLLLRAAAALTGASARELWWDCLALGHTPVQEADVIAQLSRPGDRPARPPAHYLLAIAINERLLDLGLAPLLDPQPLPAGGQAAGRPSTSVLYARAALARATATALYARAAAAHRTAALATRYADDLNTARARRTRDLPPASRPCNAPTTTSEHASHNIGPSA